MRDAISGAGDVVESFAPLEVAGRPARALTFHRQPKNGVSFHTRGVLVPAARSCSS